MKWPDGLSASLYPGIRGQLALCQARAAGGQGARWPALVPSEEENCFLRPEVSQCR